MDQPHRTPAGAEAPDRNPERQLQKLIQHLLQPLP